MVKFGHLVLKTTGFPDLKYISLLHASLALFLALHLKVLILITMKDILDASTFIAYYTCKMTYFVTLTCAFSPGGELNPGEDEVEGLKRLMTEVLFLFSLHFNLIL